MIIKIFSSDTDFRIQIEPENIEESSQLMRLNLQGNFKISRSQMRFAEENQYLTIDLPTYASKRYHDTVKSDGIIY